MTSQGGVEPMRSYRQLWEMYSHPTHKSSAKLMIQHVGGNDARGRGRRLRAAPFSSSARLWLGERVRAHASRPAPTMSWSAHAPLLTEKRRARGVRAHTRASFCVRCVLFMSCELSRHRCNSRSYRAMHYVGPTAHRRTRVRTNHFLSA